MEIDIISERHLQRCSVIDKHGDISFYLIHPLCFYHQFNQVHEFLFFKNVSPSVNHRNTLLTSYIDQYECISLPTLLLFCKLKRCSTVKYFNGD